jgi:two-component SAPR family response regulator
VNDDSDSQGASLRIHTLGGFRVWRDDFEVHSGSWGREKAVHLFQFFVTRRGQPLHKEQIVDRLWPELDFETGDRDFKVALNALYKAIEPEREARAPSRFILRHGLTYQLDLEEAWVDAQAFETHVELGNRLSAGDSAAALQHYRLAVDLYQGDYLPERRYEDWSSSERERMRLLALATMVRLADLLLGVNSLESLRLTQRVLALDPLWEDAYRVQMRAHLAGGNRPMVIRTYQKCADVLKREFGLEPLPETRRIYESVRSEIDE